ncbi:glycosyltransferase [Thermus sp. LT1-2-5]|uniref:glycosyltransferase n=1 Tax=Thermus sp. LT1-2-5 TaxID=3026935 RepID=UPI0033656B10
MALMRVLHILEATGGGTARHVVDLCEGLARRGVDVHLAYSPLRADAIWEKGLENLIAAGVHLVEVPMRRSPHPSDLQALLSLRRYLAQKGPFDLVHGHSSKAGALARLLRLLGGPPVVYTPHGFVTLARFVREFQEFGAGSLWLYEMVERGLSLLTDRLVAVADQDAEEAFRLGYPRTKVRVILHGIRLDEPQPGVREEVRRAWGVEEDDVVVGFVGRLDPQKSPQTLLKAFAKVAREHPKARLVIVGRGALEGELKRLAEELGVDVIWAGFMEGRRAMKGMDVFVLPSSYEGLPYALLEAAAEGLPLVATNLPSVSRVATERNALIIPPGDVEALVEALRLLLADEVLRHSMGMQSKKLAEGFSVERMVGEVLELYQDMLGVRV